MGRILLIFVALVVLTSAAASQTVPENSPESDNNLQESAQEYGDLIKKYDKNTDRNISTQELQEAVNDWRKEKIETEELLKINYAWRRGIKNKTDKSVDVSLGKWSDVNVGDTVVFGSNDQNKLSIEFFRERESRDFRDMGVMPGIGPGTISDDPLRIIFPDNETKGGRAETEFNSGTFKIEVKDFSVSEQSAKIKILPVYSQSSNFDCQNYDLNENQYKFCNTGEGNEVENTLNLGDVRKRIKFIYNRESYSNTSNIVSVFQSQDNLTWVITDNGSNYHKADIELVEWRGLRSGHGKNYQAIIQVDKPEPEKTPEASISFGSNEYIAGDTVQLGFEAVQEGQYKLEVDGSDIQKERIFEEGEGSETVEIESSRPGKVEATLKASGSWWNPIDNDKKIDTATTEVINPGNEDNSDESREIIEGIKGEVYNLTIWEGDKSIEYDGKTFYPYNTYRVAGDENPPTGVRFKWSDGSSTLYRKNEKNRNIFLCDYGEIAGPNYAQFVVGDVNNPSEKCGKEGSENSLIVKADYGELIEIRNEQLAEIGDDRISSQGIYSTGAVIDGESFQHYRNNGYEDKNLIICETDRKQQSAKLTLTREESNPYQVCETKIPEKREEASDSYNLIQYSLGDKIKVEEKEGIQFGESTAYIRSIKPDQYKDVYGYKEWPKENASGAIFVSENRTTTEWFKEGEMAIAACEVSENEADIIIKKTDNIDNRSEWPEKACNQETSSGTNEASLTLNTSEIHSGRTLGIDTTVTEKIAERGFQITIEDSDGTIIWERTSEEQEASYETNIDDEWSSGKHKAILAPQSTFLGGLLGSITGSENLASETFTVVNDQTKWKTYCKDQQYNTEEVEQQVSCITEEIVSRYFQESVGENPEIAESLCSDLLGYKYNQKQTKCIE